MHDRETSPFTEASKMTPQPEHESKNELTKWLEDHDASVFWEEANDWDHPTFTIERNSQYGGIPDLLVLIGGYTFIIEYKTGDSVSQLYDAHTQLRGYWREYVTNDLTYYIDDIAQSIDGFLTASQHTPKGRLFPEYAEIRQDHLDMDKGRRSCYEYGQLPPAEYRMTEQHSRILWRDVKEIVGDEKATASETANIGVLVSDVLERPSDNPTPAVLWNAGVNNQEWEVLD